MGIHSIRIESAIGGGSAGWLAAAAPAPGNGPAITCVLALPPWGWRVLER